MTKGELALRERPCKDMCGRRGRSHCARGRDVNRGDESAGPRVVLSEGGGRVGAVSLTFACA